MSEAATAATAATAAAAAATDGIFKYTQQGFWGGPSVSYSLLMLFTLLGGFFGLDHLLLRSPSTGFLKFAGNIFSLGLWYIYDIIQVFGERDTVMEKGLSIPGWGAAGIGAGMFTDNQPGVERGKSPWRYLAYMALIYLPFGFDYFVAGDVWGGLLKFLTFFLVITIPINLLWTAVNWGYSTFMPQSLFEKGTLRMFPVSVLNGTYGPSKLGPRDLPLEGVDVCDSGSVGPFVRFLQNILPPTVLGVLSSVFPGVVPAVQTVAAATQASAAAVKAAANTASGVIKAVGEPALEAAEAAGSILQQVPGGLQTLSSVPGKIAGNLQSFTDPAKLAAMAAASAGSATANKLMRGGGMVAAVEEGNPMANAALFGLLAVILAGGTYMGFQRLNAAGGNLTAKKNDRQERNDTPPKP
jgi:hypothetical protein